MRVTQIVDFGRWPATNRNVIEIWEVASGEKRGELLSNGPVADVAFAPDGRQLASSSDDSTILIWDPCRPLQPANRSGRPTEEEIAECWEALLQIDAVKADSAIWRLVDGDEEPRRAECGPGSASCSGTSETTTSGRGAAAHAELASHAELVLGDLEKGLQGDGRLEAQKRLASLIASARAAARPFGTNDPIGQERTLEVLERIESPEAGRFLRELANGAPGARLTIAARAIAATRSK